MPHEVESAAIHGQAWHSAGRRLDHLMTVEEALEESGLGDWMLKKYPARTLVPHADLDSAGIRRVAALSGAEYLSADTNTPSHVGYWSVPIDRFGHFRTKDWTLLGDVGPDYQSIANEYGFDVFKLLCDKNGLNVAKIQSAGSLRGGKRVWVLLSLPDSGFTVGAQKSQILPYMLFWNAHDGSQAANFQLTTVNVVCMNTLNAALGEKYAQISVKVRHTGDINAKMKDVQDMMAQAALVFGDFKRIGDELDSKPVTPEAFGEVMNFLFPPLDEAKASNKQIANRNTRIMLLGEAIKQEVALLPQYTITGAGNPQFSYWTLLQGVTRFTTHMQGVRVLKSQDEGEQRFESQVIGGGAEFNAAAAKKIMTMAEVK